MFIDICFPKKNEKEFLKIAEKLGTKKLLFVYEDKTVATELSAGILDKPSAKMKHKIIIGSGNRRAIEHFSTKVIYGMEKIAEKDSVRQPQSGMNEVLIRIMKRKNKAYGLMISDLIENTNLVNRFKQNVKLCEKDKVPIVLASFATKPEQLKSKKNLEDLGKYLGINQPKVCTDNLANFLEKQKT